jgi:hypothetical protein
MAVIDIGPGATNRASSLGFSPAKTVVNLTNPANDTGILDTFEFFGYGSNLTNVKIGTFSGSDTSYDDRDYESIGTVNSGSKQTFTGKNCDVVTGDFLGMYADGGSIERDTSGYDSYYYASGDLFGTGSNTYTGQAGDAISIYATGATAAAGNPYHYYLQQ